MKKVKYGGITYGKSHKEGGIPVKNASTGDMLEVEGGEGIVNKRSMASDKKVKLNGKEMTICEAVSQLNQLEGGVQFSCDDVSDRQFIEAMAKGGELERGTRTEAEHIQVLKDLYAKRITPQQAAKRIAKDHLKEDKRYYTKLAKMEGKMAEGGMAENLEMYINYESSEPYEYDKVTNLNTLKALQKKGFIEFNDETGKRSVVNNPEYKWNWGKEKYQISKDDIALAIAPQFTYKNVQYFIGYSQGRNFLKFYVLKKGEDWNKYNSEGKMAKGGKAKTDRSGNQIGDGSFHNTYNIIDFEDYPQVEHRVDKSATTESVYVTYSNRENDKSIKVRFSNHENNAVKFGDELNGDYAGKIEVLYHLGLAERVFVPNTHLEILSRQVKKSLIKDYEFADKTMKELYDMGEGADLSKYKGKLAKDSNYLILGDTVTRENDMGLDAFGRKAFRGTYKYKALPKEGTMANGGKVSERQLLIDYQNEFLTNRYSTTIDELNKSSEFFYVINERLKMAKSYARKKIAENKPKRFFDVTFRTTFGGYHTDRNILAIDHNEAWSEVRKYHSDIDKKHSIVLSKVQPKANEQKMADGGKVQSLIDSGVVELEIYDAPSEHAQQYGIDAQNPLYVKRIFIKDIERQKGLGNEVLMYLDQYAREHNHDAIFGHITQQAKPSIAIIKQMLNKNGYSTSTTNNDFWKEMDADIRFDDGGQAKSNNMKQGGQTKDNPFAELGLKKDFVGSWNDKIDYFLKKSDNFCDVEKKYCQTSIDIDRADMPQIYEEYIPQYMDFLEAQGIESRYEHNVQVGDLHPTQKNISTPRIKRMLERLLNGYYTDSEGKLMNPLKKVLVVTKDGYLLDGHHRWASLLFLSPKNTVDVLMVDANIKDLVPISKKFGMVEFQKFMFGGKVMADQNEPFDITKQKKLVVKRGGFPTKGVTVMPVYASEFDPTIGKLNGVGFKNIGFTFSIGVTNMDTKYLASLGYDLKKKLEVFYPNYGVATHFDSNYNLNTRLSDRVWQLYGNIANQDGFVISVGKVDKTFEISIIPSEKSRALLEDDSFLDNVMDALNSSTKFPNAVLSKKIKDTTKITVPAPFPRFYEENRKYRFKTEKELEFEFGKNWRDRFEKIESFGTTTTNFLGQKKFDFLLGKSINLLPRDWIRFFSEMREFRVTYLGIPLEGKIKQFEYVKFSPIAITYDGFIEEPSVYNSAKRYRFLTKQECIEKGLNSDAIFDSFSLRFPNMAQPPSADKLLLPEMLFGQIIPTPVFEWFKYLADLQLYPTQDEKLGAIGSVWKIDKVFDTNAPLLQSISNIDVYQLIENNGEYKDYFVYEGNNLEIPKQLRDLIDFLVSFKNDKSVNRTIQQLRVYNRYILTLKIFGNDTSEIGDLLGFRYLLNLSFAQSIYGLFPTREEMIFALDANSPYIKEFTYEDESLSINPKIFSEENIVFTYNTNSTPVSKNNALDLASQSYYMPINSLSDSERELFFGANIPKPIFEFFRYAHLVSPFYGNKVSLGNTFRKLSSKVEDIAFSPSITLTRASSSNPLKELFLSLSLFDVLKGSGENGEDLYKWNLDNTIYANDPLNKTYAPKELYNLCMFISNGNESWTSDNGVDLEQWNIGLFKILPHLRFSGIESFDRLAFKAVFFENEWIEKNPTIKPYSYKRSLNQLDLQINAIQTLMDSFTEDETQVKGYLLKEIQKLRNDREKELQSQFYSGNLKGLLGLYAKKVSAEQRIADPNNGCGLATPSGAPSELDLIQYKIVRTNEFMNWFGDWQLAYETKNYEGVSKAINPTTGEPMIFYHGKGNMQVEATKFGFGVFPLKYFGANFSYAQWFANAYNDIRVIYEFYVQVKNPIDFSRIELENLTGNQFKAIVSALYGYEITKPVLPENNPVRLWQILRGNPIVLSEIRDNTDYDGFIFYEDNPQEILPNGERNRTLAYGTFKNEQSKAADGRNTTFFASAEDFRFKKGGLIKNKA